MVTTELRHSQWPRQIEKGNCRDVLVRDQENNWDPKKLYKRKAKFAEWITPMVVQWIILQIRH